MLISEYDRQARLNRFEGAAAISSADYFDRGDGPSSGTTRERSGDDLDLSAADLVNRLSFQVGCDGGEDGAVRTNRLSWRAFIPRV